MVQIRYEGKVPSVNTIWRHTVKGGKARTYLSSDGKSFINTIALLCREQMRGLQQEFPYTGDIKVQIDYFYKGRAKDLDNISKGILDGIEKAEVYKNDYQVSRLYLIRHKADWNGLIVIIQEI
jgi:Holliday junction resolvase RusA-like endonuclease